MSSVAKQNEAHEILSGDLKELVALADKKGLKRITDIPLKIKRLMTLFADKAVKDQSSELAQYIDPNGEISSGAGGLMIQIGIRFNTHYGFKVSHDMTMQQARAVEDLRFRIAEVIEKGRLQYLTRREIKDKIYALIEKCGNNYRSLENE